MAVTLGSIGLTPQVALVSGLYRVRIGPYADAAGQTAAAGRVRDLLNLTPALVGP